MKILVAMSDGVDSTVTACKLKNLGHEVIGCYTKLHGKPNYHEENIKKVEKAANFLQIPYHILDLQEDFKNKVYMPFVDTYKEGKIPNPCALCNRSIKLGKLLEFARSLSCEKLATGRYARLENNLIKTAVDESKDQSYLLASADKEALKYLIFPLGEMKKEDMKKFTSTIEVLKSSATQEESSEICFVKDTYVQVLGQFMDTKIPGEVLDSSGKAIGKHEGYMHYTIGKRRGFEVRGAHKPHFVLRINPKQNQIIVGVKEELKINEFKLKNINLFVDTKELDYEVKIRYRLKFTPCKVIISDDKSANISLKESVYDLASGQMAVFYDDDKVVASGFIE